jgi:hypothetical protein
VTYCCAWHIISLLWTIVASIYKIPSKIRKLWTGHNIYPQIDNVDLEWASATLTMEVGVWLLPVRTQRYLCDLENNGLQYSGEIIHAILVLELWTLSHKMGMMIRYIYLKFEVDTLRNDKVIVKNILLHQNFNLKSGQGRVGQLSKYFV